MSSPIVFGDRVYVTSQAGDGRRQRGNHPSLTQGGDATAGEATLVAAARKARAGVAFVVEAFDRATGRRVWSHETPAKGELPPVHDKHNLATASPVTDGERVYAWFGTGQLVALNAAGTSVWTRNLATDYAAFEINWGHGTRRSTGSRFPYR